MVTHVNPIESNCQIHKFEFPTSDQLKAREKFFSWLTENHPDDLLGIKKFFEECSS